MGKTAAKKPNVGRKTAKKRQKDILRSAICGVRPEKSRMTKWRDRTKVATEKEVLVANAIVALRKKEPRKKHFGRVKVFNYLKGALSMHAVERLLSGKSGRVFEGRNKQLSVEAKRFRAWVAEKKEIGGIEYVNHLSQNSNCRISRKSDYR